MTSSRLDDVRRFYALLDDLERRSGGKRLLGHCHGRQSWPPRGVYFFFEPGEQRTTSGSSPRVVRVGTHALKVGAKSKLWGRLRSHRGTVRGLRAGEGNHRGSVFRLHVGTACLNQREWPEEVRHSWGVGSNAAKAIRDSEGALERAVSEHIAEMSLLWLEVNDPPGPESLRGYEERNSVALLSNCKCSESSSVGAKLAPPIDPRSPRWLGRYAASERVRLSGLWNSDHVDDEHDPRFLDVVHHLVSMI